jgi:hypothetical protein
LADLDGDGIDDMISGEYWPGDITWFRGLGKGRFAKGEFLKDPDGKHANAGAPWKSSKKPEMDSLAAAPWLVDWDDDGDLDLLVGNISGHVVLLTNTGDKKRPVFVRKGPIEADGKVLDAGHNDAGPTVADWDGDGLWDLVVGSGNGSVTFFKNVGSKGKPRLAAGVELVSAGSHEALASADAAKRPGSRTKPHVCDWNGDGQLDLLAGDYQSTKKPEPKLTEEQKQRRDELQEQQKAISKKLSQLGEARQDEDGELTGDAKKEYDAVLKQYTDLHKELAPLIPGQESHGWVWVYLRKPPVTSPIGASPRR